MLNLSKVDPATKENYFENHSLDDDRLSLLKAKSGWALPSIYAAARAGDVDQVRRLINITIRKEGKRACIDRRCVSTGRSIIHEAAAFGHKDLVDMMVVEFKADIQSRTVMGQDSPLHLAAMKNLRAMCFWLITKYGADPEALNKYNWTPVHYGAFYGNLSTLKVLVNYGGKPSSKNSEGKTPSMIAMERGADDDITTFLFTKLEEESRIAYLADLEGRKLENAALAAATKLETEAELKAKNDKFAADTREAYHAWKHPPAIRDVKKK
jgi:hypothetical protein